LSFIEFLREGGEEAGKMELAKISYDDAFEYANKLFNGKLLEEIPDFESNFKLAQSKAHLGKTVRKDMPVIDNKDVKDFQRRLENGYIDINAPYSKENKNEPFPEGLKGEKAKEWLESGLAKHDGGKQDDDKIDVSIKKIKVGKLKPIQKQIYFDKSIKMVAAGLEKTANFLKNESTFIVSDDNFIIDGHHRFLAAVLIDPDMDVNCMVISLPIKKLLPMSLAYGDAIGNERNQ
jgi:ParB-like chromosome segregation protein Spo0J